MGYQLVIIIYIVIGQAIVRMMLILHMINQNTYGLVEFVIYLRAFYMLHGLHHLRQC